MYREALEADLAKLGTPAGGAQLKKATTVSATPELAQARCSSTEGEDGAARRREGASTTARRSRCATARS